MKMTARHLTLALALVSLLGGCTTEPAEYLYATDLWELEFNLHSQDMGIHPDVSVLDDPNNPFRWSGVGSATKWEIEGAGLNIASFYAWATLLVVQPTGEHQFYAARNLHDMYIREEVDDEHLLAIRGMAIRGYQALLDYFPDGVSYLADGSTFFSLAPLAYQGIIDLGASPQGGWTLITLPDGRTVLVRQD
jgi:hypothetical protein